MNIDREKAQLDRICNSNTFKNAPTSKALLQFLYEASLKGVDLKESIIDIDFFGSKGTSDKANPRVRVNVYNLRKKLDSYYVSEGENDSLQLLLDKGQYNITFIKKSNYVDKIRKIKPLNLVPYLVSLLLIIVIIVILLPPSKPEIWKEFLSKKSNCTLYVGDVYGMIGTTITGNAGWTRDYSINNIDEFYKLCEKNPNLKDKLKPPPYAYTTQMGVRAAKEMQELFSEYGKEYSIRYSSKATIEKIKEGNTVYVGPIKNNNPFIKIFNDYCSDIKIVDSILYITNQKGINDTSFIFPYRVSNEEYAIVAKLPGPNNTKQLLFFSNHDIGVSSTFQYFTDKDSLVKFEKSHMKNSEYFISVFKAKGQDRTDSNLELIIVLL